MNIKSLSHIIIFTVLLPALFSCAGTASNVKKDENIHEYTNSTKNLKQSPDSLEEAHAYEVYFTLEKTVECISVSLETFNVPEKKTDESIPKNSIFVVEKILDIKSGTGENRKTYIQAGKNYNSRWEVHNPVKICSSIDDPVSRLGGAVFRVRFTTFDSKPVYFTVAVYSQVNVDFSTNPSMIKSETAPVK